LFTFAPGPAPAQPISLGRTEAEVQSGTPSPGTLGPLISQPELPPFPKLSTPDIEVRFEFEDMELEQPSVTPAAEVFLRRDYTLLRLQKGFDELLSLGEVTNLEHFWYQLETVRRVLRDFRGRALLADEVGLGKTIEACLTLKEYAMRGLVKKALILTPPSLVAQWVDELRSKFDLASVSPETGGYAHDAETFWFRHDLVVASLALARQPSNRERLAKIEYDLVIVDEAHYLKNRTTSAWGLVNELKKRFLLLLSATPVGNNLTELYNLILLLRPGLLGTEAQFRRDYGAARGPTRPRAAITAPAPKTGNSGLEDPARRDKLRGLLREVMVRNTRAHIDLQLPRRLAATEKVKPDAVEEEVLGELAGFIRTRYDSATPAERLRLMMLQMQAGSSPSALRFGLREHAASEGDDPLRAIAEKLGRLHRSAKADALLALARRSREKKIVFTRFLATLEELRLTLESEGWSVSVFHGSLSPADKEAAIADFRDRSEILLSSESGGEGRNLQFCNTVINFDLPWNPVTIEQRVGRVHRIGQTREVYVFNFCLAGSVEEYMLKVLHEKINLFELVAGEIEMILGEFGQEQDFSGIVMDLWARSTTPGERENAFERFAEELQRAKHQYQKTRELDQSMFGEDYEA
jgi:SNF2 family DNA or RNA helicase